MPKHILLLIFLSTFQSFWKVIEIITEQEKNFVKCFDYKFWLSLKHKIVLNTFSMILTGFMGYHCIKC
jgi:hypothetical protein